MPDAEDQLRRARVAEVELGHRDDVLLEDAYPEFLAQLPDQRLHLGLTLLDVPAGQVPDVRVRPSERAAVSEQDPVHVDQGADDDMRHPAIEAGSGPALLVAATSRSSATPACWTFPRWDQSPAADGVREPVLYV